MSLSDIRRPGPAKQVRLFHLPKFSEDLEPRASTEYVFTSFGENSEQVTVTLAEAEEKAKAIVAAANIKAEELLKKSREEAAVLNKQAEKARNEAAQTGFAEGQAKGLTEGRDQGKKTFEAEVASAVSAFGKVENLYKELWANNEAVMVKLAIKIAERVLLQELVTSPEVVSATFKAALDHLHEQHQVTFRVSPEDLSHLEILRNELRESIQGLVKITFEPDPNLARGDLIMETDAGRLDATLRRRMASVTAVVDEVLHNNFDLDW
jgi:flagellar assembly protein FliH